MQQKTEKKIVLSRTQKQENKDGKIRTSVSNLSSLSQDFIQKGSTLCRTVVNIGL